MTIVLSGCYLVPPKLPDDLSTLPPAVPRKRTITIVTAADRPPMMFKDKTSGEIVGADRELMTALAAEWKTELRVIEAPRDQLLDLVASGKVDLAMGGVLDTVEDQRKVTFVDYFKPGVRDLHHGRTPPGFRLEDELLRPHGGGRQRPRTTSRSESSARRIAPIWADR